MDSSCCKEKPEVRFVWMIAVGLWVLALAAVAGGWWGYWREFPRWWREEVSMLEADG
jgi:hypothetical protein